MALAMFTLSCSAMARVMKGVCVTPLPNMATSYSYTRSQRYSQ